MKTYLTSILATTLLLSACTVHERTTVARPAYYQSTQSAQAMSSVNSQTVNVYQSSVSDLHTKIAATERELQEMKNREHTKSYHKLQRDLAKQQADLRVMELKMAQEQRRLDSELQRQQAKHQAEIAKLENERQARERRNADEACVREESLRRQQQEAARNYDNQRSAYEQRLKQNELDHQNKMSELQRQQSDKMAKIQRDADLKIKEAQDLETARQNSLKTKAEEDKRRKAQEDARKAKEEQDLETARQNSLKTKAEEDARRKAQEDARKAKEEQDFETARQNSLKTKAEEDAKRNNLKASSLPQAPGGPVAASPPPGGPNLG